MVRYVLSQTMDILHDTTDTDDQTLTVSHGSTLSIADGNSIVILSTISTSLVKYYLSTESDIADGDDDTQLSMNLRGRYVLLLTTGYLT